MAELTEDQKAVAREEAQRWWESSHERLRYSVEYAQAGIKGLFLANGGGILALLTFVGNSTSEHNPIGLFWSFVWFGLGCFAALSIYIAGYQSQGYVMQAEYLHSRQAIADSLEIERVFDPEPFENKSECVERVGMLCAIASLSLFVVGALVGLDAIT